MKPTRFPASPSSALRRRRSLSTVGLALLLLLSVWILGLVLVARQPNEPSPVFRQRFHEDPQAYSVLHPRTVVQPEPQGEPYDMSGESSVRDGVVESLESFAQYGTQQRGLHFRLRNTRLLGDLNNQKRDSLLVMLVFNDAKSWGRTRTADDFFALLTSFSHAKSKTSLTMLTSDMDEFDKVQRLMRAHIRDYAEFSLLFRNDFDAGFKITRENRHETSVQRLRRRMLARYRNFALLSTLQSWHQHVVWLDADVHDVPPELVAKMISADRDILEPLCYQGDPPSTHWEYDLNAWAGVRKKPEDLQNRSDFMPGAVRTRQMNDFRDSVDDFMALDSVGGTMLYVRASIHRQGVLFPHHFVVGSEWDQEGYDAIETEGLCYSAHFLGFRCWGMPHEVIYHV